jgi:hypothetical protein
VAAIGGDRAIGAVAYADHLVVSISLGYLYISLGVGAIFLRKKVIAASS